MALTHLIGAHTGLAIVSVALAGKMRNRPRQICERETRVRHVNERSTPMNTTKFDRTCQCRCAATRDEQTRRFNPFATRL